MVEDVDPALLEQGEETDGVVGALPEVDWGSAIQLFQELVGRSPLHSRTISARPRAALPSITHWGTRAQSCTEAKCSNWAQWNSSCVTVSRRL